MSLAPGQRLGPYEVLNPIGAGGMGEVYRARDTRLQRQVALKIVPAAVADDPSALARFEREAQAVAALSHPNILAIHDIGRDDGVSYAVMELLEGRSLSELVAAGPVPIRRALDYATQIASGLAAAHERGIVHRDIKPANIFVKTDGRVTILDFGLARLDSPLSTDRSSTVAPDTSPGMIIGTIGYMAPEQVRGESVDHRADIFAFGAVLYEMLSARRAFTGATTVDTLGAILNIDPPDLVLDGSPISPAIDRIVRHCLEKEPAHRFQSTRDLEFALDALNTRSTAGAMPTAETSTSALRRRDLPAIAAVCLLASAGLGWLAAVAWRPGTSGAALHAPSAVRFEMAVPVGNPALVDVAPDGQAISWGADTPGTNTPEIWIRRLRDSAPTKVPGSVDVFVARWREDSRRLSTFRNGVWSSLDPVSGVFTPQFELPAEFRAQQFRGVAFGRDDDMLLAASDGIVRFRAGQSPAAVAVARPDKAVHDWYAAPQWLPDRSRILFMASRRDRTAMDALVQSVEGGAPVRLDLPAGITRAIVDPGGAILYGLNGTLLGQPFDLGTLKLIGDPVTIGTDVIMDRTRGSVSADVSATGVLAYRSGAPVQVQFEWVDRSGRTVGPFGSAGAYISFDLTSDNGRIAAIRRPDVGGNALWLLDGTRGIATPLADPAAGALSDPTWSPDGQRIAYRRGNTVVIRSALGGEERRIADFQGYPDSWSRDGRYLLVGRPAAGSYELWALRVDGPTEEIPLVRGITSADEGRFSPDGRWVSYHAATVVNESPQVYVIPFPPTGETVQISADGGVQPRWRGDGRELFFLDPKGRLMSVDIPGGDPRKAAAPRALFPSGVIPSASQDQFSPAADGQRFLIRRPVKGAEQQTIHVVLNWRELLK